MSESTERIHPATPYRRQAARREGRAARSRDLTAGMLLLVGLLSLLYFGDGIVDKIGHFTNEQLGGDVALNLDIDTAVEQWRKILYRFAGPLVPLLAACVLVTAATHIGQVGFLFLPERLAPDWNRISPIRGIQRLVSGDNVATLFWGLFKVAIILAIAGTCIWNDRLTILSLSMMTPTAAAVALIEILLWTSIKVATTMLVLGIADYGYQWWRREQDLKMTPEELREEMRGQQGNQAVANRRRQILQNTGEQQDRAAA